MIGRKCIHCRKPAKYHSAVHRLCPAGKRHKDRVTGEIIYTESHPTQVFEAKEPKPRGGSEKRKDRLERRRVKSAGFCQACLRRGSDFLPIDPCHVRTWKVTQSDHPANLLNFCRDCHRLQGESWGDFLRLYPRVAELLVSMGWEIAEDPFRPGRVILSHPEVA